ncbi:uncharacterized protein L201_006644 [Kwoniella dendrophila CBS 6074]|uniref:Uncharacterized protein n=1 Tax=Kwoniella dendrophila CBS 6074 TaxID=1295534 RepID=A0AAX4K3N4_9TREE
MHNRSFKSINIKRSLSISHKQFKIDSNVEEEEDGFRRLLSLSPNPDSTFRDGDKQHPEKTTAKQVLRKVHKVEGDWDLVRQGDLDGYKHSVNVIRNPDTV